MIYEVWKERVTITVKTEVNVLERFNKGEAL